MNVSPASGSAGLRVPVRPWVMVLVVCGSALLTLAGCSRPPVPPTQFGGRLTDPGHGSNHTHDRGRLMLEDAELPDGTACHAALTAHLSRTGTHALEVSFETIGKDPRPVALSEQTRLVLTVRRGGETYTLELQPGPKDERPTDPAGRCSRFEAPAPWLKPDDTLTVTLRIAGSDQEVAWNTFEVARYSHEAD